MIDHGMHTTRVETLNRGDKQVGLFATIDPSNIQGLELFKLTFADER